MASSTELTITRLSVQGSLPAGLSGQLVGIAADGSTHSLYVHAGRAVSYRRRMVTDTGLRHIVGFGGAILAITDQSLAYELSWDLAVLRRVDLAGQSRAITGRPKVDPASGELHLLATTTAGVQSHVVVSAGGLTRANYPIAGGQGPLTDLLITQDGVVFIADDLGDPSSTDFAFVADGGWLVGFVHVASRDATEFVVRDSAVLAGSAVARVRIARSIPRGLHLVWIPSTNQSTTTNQGEIK